MRRTTGAQSVSPKGDEAPRAVSPRVQRRTEFYDSARQLTPFLGTRAGRGMFMVRTEDKHVGRSLFGKQGRGEMTVLARAVDVLHALVGPQAVQGRVFIDVGANIGTTTVPAVLEHRFGRAVAIEPEHDNAVTLRINALLNGLEDQVVVLALAASNEVGTSELVVNRERGGKHWIATDDEKKQIANPFDEIVEVQTTTLDQLASEGVFDPAATGMLWIDAQAHEGHILEGAQRLTSLGVPLVLEWDPRALDAVGDRGKIQRTAEQCYTHFAGMRADSSGDGPRFWLRPVAELGAYAERFLDPSRSDVFTDILILRLTDKQIPKDRAGGVIDLSAVIRRESLLRVERAEPIPVEPKRSPEALYGRQRARERRRAERRKARQAQSKAARAQLKGMGPEIPAEDVPHVPAPDEPAPTPPPPAGATEAKGWRRKALRLRTTGKPPKPDR